MRNKNLLVAYRTIDEHVKSNPGSTPYVEVYTVLEIKGQSPIIWSRSEAKKFKVFEFLNGAVSAF